MSMNKNRKKNYSDINYGSSRFLIPFWADNTECYDRIIGQTGAFKQEYIKVRYLSKFIEKLFSMKEDEESEKTGFCRKYALLPEKYTDFKWPQRNTDLVVKSRMPQAEGEFLFQISNIHLYIFETGIGFLEIETRYNCFSEKSVADVSFCISNAINNEHDKKVNENKLSFETVSENAPFSIKNAIYETIKHDEGQVELFPNSSRRRMTVFHNLILDSDSHEPMKIENLKRVLAGGVDNLNPDEESVDYYPTTSQLWGISSSGIASIGLKDGNNGEFLIETYKNNVYNDYYSIFLLALYEREMLLKYNQMVVENYDNPKALIDYRSKILKLSILFSYTTVSTEQPYQRFYDKLCVALNLNNLENDLSNIVEKVDEYVNEKKEHRTSILLSAVALLALFSVVCDSFGIADRICCSENSMTPLHFVFLAIIVIVVGVGVYSFFKKKK